MRFSILYVLLVVLSLVEQICCDGDQTWGVLSKDVSDALDTMWQSFKNTVRRPVTLKRKGRRARRTRYPYTTTKTSTTTSTVHVRETSPSRTPSRWKLELPVIPYPNWRGVAHWRQLQKPRFAVDVDIDNPHEVNTKSIEIKSNNTHYKKKTFSNYSFNKNSKILYKYPSRL